MYYKLWPDLLKLIRQSYLRESDIAESEFIKTYETKSFRKQYCLEDYSRNLITTPIEKHKCELKIEDEREEFSYIGSRKALCFNLFGNDSVYFRANPFGISEGEFKINYMQKMPVIRGKNSNIIADALLYNEEAKELIVSRVRFLEWIVLKNDVIKEQHLDSTYYLTASAGKVFSGTIKELLSVCGGDGMGFLGKYYDFDSLHVIKEIIAAYNLMETYSGIINVNKLTIAEVYWKPYFYENLDQYAGRVYLKEKNRIKESEEMMRIIPDVVELFKKEFNAELKIKCIDIWKMLQSLKKSKEELKWMKRFII